MERMAATIMGFRRATLNPAASIGFRPKKQVNITSAVECVANDDRLIACARLFRKAEIERTRPIQCTRKVGTVPV
jgi:hypothetical protein